MRPRRGGPLREDARPAAAGVGEAKGEGLAVKDIRGAGKGVARWRLSAGGRDLFGGH